MPRRPTDAELATWEAFQRYQRSVVERLDAELRAETDLTLDEYDVLHQLRVAPDRRLRMGELAELVVITRSSCSRLVDRLAKRGLVARERDEADRRVVWAHLTDEGRKRHRRAAPVHLRGIARWFAEPLDAPALDGIDRALRCWSEEAAPIR
ncbi:MAG: MarR family transcriptional regulator [Actinomycetota bacterium]